jgi:hypothetical protein
MKRLVITTGEWVETEEGGRTWVIRVLPPEERYEEEVPDHLLDAN